MKRLFLFVFALVLSLGHLPTVNATTFFSEDFASKSLGQMTPVNFASNANWVYGSYQGDDFAKMNGYGADVASDDWLLTPQITLPAGAAANLFYTTIKGFDGPALQVMISTDYDGSGTPTAVQAATWTTLGGALPTNTTGYSSATSSGPVDLSAYAGQKATIAFRYTSTGTVSGAAATWEVLDVQVGDGGAAPSVSASASETSVLTQTPLTFNAKINGGTPPLQAVWQFSDGLTQTGAQVQHQFLNPGDYTATVTVTDANGLTATSAPVNVTALKPQAYVLPEPKGTLRVATFNTYLNRTVEGELAADLGAGDAQAAAVAEIIQRVRPDVILLNEFDYDPSGDALDLFERRYLAIGQNGAHSIQYPYHYAAPVNTGVQSGQDLDHNGKAGDPGDAFGFGSFPGQYGMVILSMYPIEADKVRTFQKFLWKDMPNALLPKNPDGSSYYTPAELDVFRLSSKSHWDVPVDVNGKTLHILASHPTPPVFDDGTIGVDKDVVDWNGTRNHDEIRLWADYIDPAKSGYIVDDKGSKGGLSANARFVIVGDENADPKKGDSTNKAILQLLDNPLVTNTDPTSIGALDNTDARFGASADDTIEDGLRLDYVLPSTFGVTVDQGQVFWPGRTYDLSRLTGFQTVISSDHRMNWQDMTLNATAVDDVMPSEPTPDSGNTATSNDGGSGAVGPWALLLLTGPLLLARIIRRKHNNPA